MEEVIKFIRNLSLISDLSDETDYFNESKKYIEIAAFGDCTYRIISAMYEISDTYTIDYNSKEYKDYLDKLYPYTVHKLVDKLYKEELSVKLQFLQQQMECLN